MLTLSEYHTPPPLPSLIQISLAFIASSAACATLSLMSATQLSLRYRKFNDISNTDSNEPRQPIRGGQLLLVSIPGLLLEWSVFAFLVGLLLWYTALPGRSTVGFALVSTNVGVLWLVYMLTRGEQRGTASGEELQDIRKIWETRNRDDGLPPNN
jgi:hypothetical protein